jgi:hypothetical protein
MRRLLAVFFWIGVTQAAAAEDPRWVTFKTGHNDWGTIQHQIDRQTIRYEGPTSWTFWTRQWRVEAKTELVASYYGMLIFWSQKFTVDCTAHRFGRYFIDSNLPSERKRKASLATMRWEDLKKFPAVERTVCAR